MSSLESKLRQLKENLAGLESVVVAFSGGVDSTFLLKVCHDILGEGVLAVTADSPIHPSHELSDAVKMAELLHVKHLVIQTDELQNPNFVANPLDRCYHCKAGLFRALKEIAEAHRALHIVEGSNHDDLEDYRPGMRAAAELGICHPLQEVGLTKAEMRAASKKVGLPVWDKPSLACLVSRIPYGTPITREALASIDAAEAFIRSLGIAQVRVRHYGETARIEVEPRDIETAACEANRQRIISHLEGLGYRHVTLDLAGYRSGSMNKRTLS